MDDDHLLLLEFVEVLLEALPDGKREAVKGSYAYKELPRLEAQLLRILSKAHCLPLDYGDRIGP
jgi:hypothetical protein